MNGPGFAARFDRRRPAPDPVVFHEDDPATRASEREPFSILDALSLSAVRR
jgi:hypothetical protein